MMDRPEIHSNTEVRERKKPIPKSNHSLRRPSYPHQVIHAQHPRVPARPFPPRATSTTSFAPLSRRLLLALYHNATAHSGSTRRRLHRPDRRGAYTLETTRGGTALRHDPVDRHVAERAGAARAAAPPAPLPPNPPGLWWRSGHRGHRARGLRFQFRLGPRLQLRLCRGPYEGVLSGLGRGRGRTGNVRGERGYRGW
jgi:hypothetical protein